MSFYRRWIGWAVLVLVVDGPWQAAQAQSPEVTEIVIHPAGVPRPALKYRLLPRLSDQVPGVAAPLYAQACLAIYERKVDDETWGKMGGAWINGPLEEVPRKEAAEALANMDGLLKCVDQAARRPRFGMDVAPGDYGPLLPTASAQLGAFRAVARLLRLRIRVQALEGDHQGAMRTLQTGYAMARHCAEQPTTPNALVGFALIGVVSHGLEELIQTPDVPNLYWAITALPDPMIDLGPVFDFEATVLESTFPEYGRMKTAGATPDEWRGLLERVVHAFYPPEAADESPEPSEDGGDDRPVAGVIDVDVLIKKGLPVARRVLLSAGVSEAELNGMSPAETAVRAAFAVHRSQCDELAKWHRIPYWQARPGIERSVDEFRRLLEELGLPPGSERTSPAYSLQVHHMAAARTRLHLAGLRVIEAIRLYAAEHNGELPQRLEDITEVPVPVNPMTGKPFTYRAEERYVILDLDGCFFNRQWWIRLADE